MSTPAPRRLRAWRPWLLGALALAVVVQLVVLYAPSEPVPPPFPNADKVVHCLVFLAPTVLAIAARLPWRWVVAVLAAHAVLSEVVQATLLPDRDGDVLDALADLTGVALGALAGWWLLRRAAARPPSGSAASRW